MSWYPLPLQGSQPLAGEGQRAHVCVEGRYVTVIQHNAAYYCVDSSCFHSGGPLGNGALEDIENIPCIRCPSHGVLIALDTGEEIVQEVKRDAAIKDGVLALTPSLTRRASLGRWPKEMLGPPQRGKPVQRVHTVQQREGGQLWVKLPDPTSREFDSDGPSTNNYSGPLCMKISQMQEK